MGIVLTIFIVFIVGMVFDVTCDFREVSNPIHSTLIRLKNRNRLYKCNNHYRTNVACDRLFRRYQWDLYNQKHDSSHCPHCQTSIIYTLDSRIDEVKKPDKWMNHHSDCPKISMKELLKLNHTMNQLGRIKTGEEEIKRFEDYNKMKVDLKWIENLQKANYK